jgi:hypothetical protein
LSYTRVVRREAREQQTTDNRNAPPPTPLDCGSTSASREHHLHRNRGVERAATGFEHLVAASSASGLAATTMNYCADQPDLSE